MIREAANSKRAGRGLDKGRRESSRHRGMPANRGASRSQVRDEDGTAHLSLVRQVVQQVQGTLPASIEYDEIMSWGVDGLLDASRKFDSSKGTSFSTYARIRIRGAAEKGISPSRAGSRWFLGQE